MHFDNHSFSTTALRDLVEGGGVPFKSSKRSYILWCPDCNHQKLYVERETGASKCFRCGTSKWAHVFLAPIYGRGIDELGALFYGIVTVGTFLDESKIQLRDFWGEEEDEDSLLPTEPEYPPEMMLDPMVVPICDPAAQPGVDYLAKRGVPLETAMRYSVWYNAQEQRIIFPVIVDDKLRGWQGRYIHPTEIVDSKGKIYRIPKAITTGKLGKKCLMFQDRLKDAKHAVLVEGPLDAIKCDLLGGNVCSMGKDVSPQQLDIIVRSGIKKLYVGLDRDATKEVGRIVRELYGTLKLHRLLPPPHRNDLGDCTFDEVVAQFDIAELMGPGHVFQVHAPMPSKWL